jgi:Arc/MetJ family transcription regulator
MMPNVRRTSMNLDLELVEQAKAELGTKGTTETVHRALEDVVRRAAMERLLQTTAAIFSEPPPDGYEEWNDWIEESQHENHGP